MKYHEARGDTSNKGVRVLKITNEQDFVEKNFGRHTFDVLALLLRLDQLVCVVIFVI